MCGGILGAIFGGGQKEPAPVVESHPMVDENAAKAAAAVTSKDAARRRRLAGNRSLLGSGGNEGDLTQVAGAAPAAKPVLGA